MTALLLDTCAIIFIAENQAIDPLARQEVTAAGGSGGVLVSPISAWEIGLLATKRGFAFFPDPKAWFQSFMLNPGVRLTPLTPEMAIESSFLPPLHADPADRLLIATARAMQVPIVTRDRQILAYAQAGVVMAIAC
jgi:PIN domain nuclease of toxin-antitoxin system